MSDSRSEGFSLIELLIVIVILGILAAVVVAAVGGFTEEAEETRCESDAHTLQTASEAYFAQRDATTILGTGTTADRYEKTLVAGGFFRDVSSLHDLAADGRLVEVAGAPCTV